MSMLGEETLEQYQNILAKDPRSKVFAPLCESYRRMGLLQEAKELAKKGAQFHPRFVSGLIVYARILMDLENWGEAEKFLKNAIEIAPDNLLGYQLFGEIHIKQKKFKSALQAFKMVLFLDATNERALKTVSKLESLLAEDFPEEAFQFFKIDKLNPEEKSAAQQIGNSEVATNPLKSQSVLRHLSLIDAFLVRNNFEKARQAIEVAEREVGDFEELKKRRLVIAKRTRSLAPQDAPVLHPQTPRAILIRERHIAVLRHLLAKFESLTLHPHSP